MTSARASSLAGNRAESLHPSSRHYANAVNENGSYEQPDRGCADISPIGGHRPLFARRLEEDFLEGWISAARAIFCRVNSRVRQSRETAWIVIG